MLGYPMFGKRLERRWRQHNATLAGDCFEVSYLIASAFPIPRKPALNSDKASIYIHILPAQSKQF